MKKIITVMALLLLCLGSVWAASRVDIKPAQDFSGFFIVGVLCVVAGMCVAMRHSNAFRIRQETRQYEASYREQKAALTGLNRILDDVLFVADAEHLVLLFDAAVSLRLTATDSLHKLDNGLLLSIQDVEGMVSLAHVFKDLAENNRDYCPQPIEALERTIN